MKLKFVWMVLLLLQNPISGSAGHSAGAVAVTTHTVPLHHVSQQPALQLDLQLQQLTALLTDAAQRGQFNAQSTPQWQYRLQQLEHQWQRLFQQQESLALNKIYNQFQVEIQLLQHAMPELNTATLTTHIQTLEQLRLHLSGLTGNADTSHS